MSITQHKFIILKRFRLDWVGQNAASAPDLGVAPAVGWEHKLLRCSLCVVFCSVLHLLQKYNHDWTCCPGEIAPVNSHLSPCVCLVWCVIHQLGDRQQPTRHHDTPQGL